MLLQFGAVHLNKCNFEKALEFYKKSKDICIGTTGEHNPMIKAINSHIANLHRKMGDESKALEYSQNSEDFDCRDYEGEFSFRICDIVKHASN